MDSTEVICISSDDDEATGESNSNFIAQSQSKPVVSENCVQTKSEKKEEERSVQKRKFSIQQVTNAGQPRLETKRRKISLTQTENNNVSLTDKNCTTSETTSGNEDIENAKKPQLVVKEKRSISPVEQHPFPMFISLCLQKDRSQEMTIIVNKLKTRYEQLHPSYSKSPEFIEFLNQQREAIMNSTKKFYSYIQNVMNEMKSSIKGQSQLRENSTNSNVSNEKIKPNEETSNDNTNTDETKKNIKRELRIKKIDMAMGECQARIKRLEEAEMDFDEEENSNYLKLERYKKRMVELYNARCHLTGERTDAGRPYLRPKHLTPTGIAAVDAAISNFINSKINKWNRLKKKKSAVEAVIFPDYVDILRCITLCNNTRDLGLSIKKQREIAKKAFVQLGEYLQRMRFTDYWDTFSFYLENEQEDPALNDSDLTSKLVQNRKDGEKRLANVFQEFVNKQEAAKDRLSEDNGTNNKIEDEAEGEENEAEDEEDEAEDEEDEAEDEEDEAEDEEDEIEQNNKTDQNSSAEDNVESNINNDQSDTRKNKRIPNENDVTVNNIDPTDKDGSEVIELDDDIEVNGHAIVSESNRNSATSIKPLDKKSIQEDHLKSASVRKEPEVVDIDTTALNKQLTLGNTVSPMEMTPKVTNDSEGKNLPETETQDSVNDTRCQTDGENSAEKDKEEENCKEDDKLKDCNTQNVEKDNEISRNVEGCREQMKEEGNDIDQEKPMLRVRAFAKPPTTWKDGEHKTEKTSKSQNSSNNSGETEIVDLTDCSPIHSKIGPVLPGKPFLVKLRKLNVPAAPKNLERRDLTIRRVLKPPNELKNEATGRAVILNQANVANSPLANVIQSSSVKLQNVQNKSAINGQPASVKPQSVIISKAALNALRQLSITPHQGKVPSMFSQKPCGNRSQPRGENTQDNVSLKRSETNSLK